MRHHFLEQDEVMQVEQQIQDEQILDAVPTLEDVVRQFHQDVGQIVHLFQKMDCYRDEQQVDVVQEVVEFQKGLFPGRGSGGRGIDAPGVAD